MALYRVMRTYNHTEYSYIEADSEEEARERAIEDDCWEENPNDTLLGYEYITIKEDNG